MANTNHSLSTPVQFLKGIGEKRAAKLKDTGVETIFDLLYYFPRRYLDRSRITKIKDLKPGDPATVVGTVQFFGVKKGRRNRFELVLHDGTGFLTCVWFHRLAYWTKVFTKGETLAVSGKVGFFREMQMVHPEFDRLTDEGEHDFLHTGRIIPLYPSTEALSKVGLDSRGFRRVIKNALRDYGHDLHETLPQEIVRRHRLMPLKRAIENVHFPVEKSALAGARRRLKFDELFYLQVLLALRRRSIEITQKGIEFLKVGERTRQLVDALPFELTAAQKRVLREIRDDMKHERPMNRLIQGDVGSGKTVVALIAMMMAVENGYQAALMAPTEILAEQHYLQISRFLQSLDVEVALLIGAQKKGDREARREAVKAGDVDIVMGTHALIQEGVAFHRLGLVVIDEQHRFGVLQRAALMEKGLNPDVLVMTATPIPRTLSMTLYGDLDVSVIDELPPGRKPVKTYWRSDKKRSEIYKFVRNRVEQGAQAYIIFPLVEESEKMDLRAATESYEWLKNGMFKNINVGLLHGRMRSEEKEAVMDQFKRGDIQVLVSTTVVEVGVDVPTATLMVVEHAERFGLPQLHQLRGRVGRGDQQSYCLLIADHPVSSDAHKRLDAISSTNDGFRIAEVDLRLRGPGEFFGTRQHGLPELRIADLATDTELLIKARDEAFRLVKSGATLDLENVPLRPQFFKDYKEKFQLAQVG